MEKFRLAVFNTQPPHLYFGGVERRIIETAKRLQNQADITVYSGTKAGFTTPTTINGVKIVPCPSTDKLYPIDNWYFNRSLTKKASEIDADVYEAHAVSGYGFPKALHKLGINKPFIHTIHGVLADEYEQAKKNGYQTFRSRVANRFMRRLANLEAQTAKDATLIITISKYSLEKIQRHYRVEPSKVRIVPNGVDVEKFKPISNVEAVKEQFGLGNEPCVLFVGSLIPRKGLSFLVEAAKKIVAEYPVTKFLVVGEGSQKKELTATLQAANLLGNFMFIGNVKEDLLGALYNCADVFVLPSIQEGQGIVLLEAQASGKPVVAFDVGGVKEAVRDGETGFLAKQGSVDALTDALLKLLSDKTLREKMGASGRKFVSENFTWDICAQKVLNVYREVLST
ncbi:MAG: glycosyltransferase family 4 protein [Candidatus Bathyarchaeota archaeon]|nr:glycosyltransferase family 4 protein [Candidatus Bathyarchaeota archaeon]